MKEEVKAGPKGDEPHKDFSGNGGIPNAFQTGPRWSVRAENDTKTYEDAFEPPVPVVPSPVQSRSGSTQPTLYANQGVVNGPAGIPHITTPQHASHGAPHHYQQQYDDGTHRMQFGTTTPAVYPSPSLASRQASTYASPMTHPAQLSYQQQPYYGTPTNQLPMQVRGFPGASGMMHGQAGQMNGPMMGQQPSNGPYMSVPQGYNHPMQMYSPSPSHVYPQQNGYASPGRMAPMMMQQGSQQGHAAPNMMFSMSAQGGPMAYPQQQMGMPRAGYGGHQYPHQGYAMQQRTMSSGYGQIPQKMHPQMHGNHGPAMNVPQGPAYGQAEAGQDEGK
jgi:hypothetical protein